jgi:hypothetical protein
MTLMSSLRAPFSSWRAKYGQDIILLGDVVVRIVNPVLQMNTTSIF